MALGTPVVASDPAALPEVVGDAGRRSSPRRPGGLGRARSTRSLDDRREAELVARRPGAGARRDVHRGAARRRDRSSAPTGLRPRMKLAVLCPHFAPDIAPTGEVMTPHRARAGRPRPRAARRDGAAVVPPPPGRAGLGRAGSCGASATEWGSITRVHPFPDATSAASRAGPSASPASARWPALTGLRGGRVDGVLAMSPPLTLGLTGWGVHRARRGAAGVQHPGRVPRRRRRARARITNRAGDRHRPLARAGCSYRRADAVTVLSDDLRDNVAAKLPDGRARTRCGSSRTSSTPTAIRPLDRTTAVPRPSSASATRPVVMYAGNVGFSQSLELVLAAARGRRRRTCVFVDQRRRLGPAATSSARPPGLPNVRFATYQPEGAPGRGAGDRRHPRGAAAAGPGRVERAVEDVLDPGRRPARSWPRSTPGTEVARVVERGRRRRRRAARRSGRVRRPPCGELLTDPDRAAAMGAGGPGAGSRGGRRRRRSPRAYEELFGELAAEPRDCRSGSARQTGSLAPSWVRHRRPRRSPGSAQAGKGTKVRFQRRHGASRSPSCVVVRARPRAHRATPATAPDERRLPARRRRTATTGTSPTASTSATTSAQPRRHRTERRPTRRRHPHPRRRRDPHPPVQAPAPAAATPS